MSKRILIAEDSSVIQNLTKKILSQLQYEISTVKNGQEVLDDLKNNPCDLVLMDIHMPVMDGMECAREIRSSNNEVPIVAITGNANNYSMDDFKEAGINNFLPKPLNYDHMLEMVKTYVGDAG
ncbi:MAG: response regulator [Cytophagales bacterium]|nr:response regulator [Cytophagales bacterium]